LCLSFVSQVLFELLGTDKAESILNPKIEEPAKQTEQKEEQRDVRKLPTGERFNLFKLFQQLYSLSRVLEQSSVS